MERKTRSAEKENGIGMETVFFSIIVVCLNPGKKLRETVESVWRQTETDYEILIKDGGSVDGSVDGLEKREKVRVFRRPDTGIYDAMNQAAKEARGEILFFLNCGDVLHDETVLKRVREQIEQAGSGAKIFYGDIYSRLSRCLVASNPRLDAFGCYRNVPCHQACFYKKELFEERGYLLQYKVRADYEHFLWCFFEKEANPLYVPVVIADYEGGGFSETKENKKISAAEHKEIVGKYMSRGKIIKYRLLLLMTLAPLRTKIAESERGAELYNRMKKILYRK